jgi:cell division protein FtsN
MTRTSPFLLCLALAFLAGCRDEDAKPTPVPVPATAPPAVAKAPEPPPFTAPDSGPRTKAEIEAGTAKAPRFTPPSDAPPTVRKAEPPTATEPESTPSTTSVVPTEQGAWVLQVGIHKTEEAANAMAAKLKAKGFPAYVLSVATGGTGLSGSYYRVRIGAFATRDDALRYGENVLKPAGLKEFWADKKSNEARAREAQLPTP